MPKTRPISSTHRRQFLANRILFLGLPVMRLCDYCVRHHFLCVTSDASEHCERCVRSHRWCELAPPSDKKWEHLQAQKRRLAEESLAAETKIFRLRKQRRFI